MINAIVRNKEVTTVIEIPTDKYSLHSEMYKIDIRDKPDKIILSDDKDSDIGVKLLSDNDFGNQLILACKEKNSLEQINDICNKISDADEVIQEELEQNVIYEQYDTLEEIQNDIDKMTQKPYRGYSNILLSA